MFRVKKLALMGRNGQNSRPDLEEKQRPIKGVAMVNVTRGKVQFCTLLFCTENHAK